MLYQWSIVNCQLSFKYGGRGIRTPERVTPLTVFKTAAFNHSAIPPFSIVHDTRRIPASPTMRDSSLKTMRDSSLKQKCRAPEPPFPPRPRRATFAPTLPTSLPSALDEQLTIG